MITKEDQEIIDKALAPWRKECEERDALLQQLINKYWEESKRTDPTPQVNNSKDWAIIGDLIRESIRQRKEKL